MLDFQWIDSLFLESKWETSASKGAKKCNYRQNGQPTNRLTDRRTERDMGKLHFQ